MDKNNTVTELVVLVLVCRRDTTNASLAPQSSGTSEEKKDNTRVCKLVGLCMEKEGAA